MKNRQDDPSFGGVKTAACCRCLFLFAGRIHQDSAALP
ncbi:hypothetical protein DAQ1742_02786 [Dickeya aquatica]|uniref:Uncharacterized protein n=1 Tax=Dickeya aquatica TaxID=1401087 RepID=A0A375AC55_9GAMM|nr:hypothetical protein DAQ1742_02786 [Dickeya aquatica]